MTIAEITNIALILLSLGVLVQTARLMIVFRRFKRADLSETVTALDQATHAAQVVLDNMRSVLAIEARANGAAIAASEHVRDELGALRDELSVMVGVGNSVAERIEEAANVARMAKPVVDVKARRRSEGTSVPAARVRRAKKSVPDRPVAIALEAGV